MKQLSDSFKIAMNINFFKVIYVELFNFYVDIKER